MLKSTKIKRKEVIKSLYPKMIQNNLEWIEYSKRFYGEPKLIKPKELKNIKQIASVPFIISPKGAIKCSCPFVFITKYMD